MSHVSNKARDIEKIILRLRHLAVAIEDSHGGIKKRAQFKLPASQIFQRTNAQSCLRQLK